jgi:hypothetical protein
MERILYQQARMSLLGRSAPYARALGYTLCRLGRRGHLAAISELTAAGADINEAWLSRTALSESLKNTPALVAGLFEMGARILPDQHASIVYFAADQSSCAVVKLLLVHGLNPDAIDGTATWGNACHVAAERGNPGALWAFMEAGVNPRLSSSRGTIEAHILAGINEAGHATQGHLDCQAIVRGERPFPSARWDERPEPFPASPLSADDLFRVVYEACQEGQPTVQLRAMLGALEKEGNAGPVGAMIVNDLIHPLAAGRELAALRVLLACGVDVPFLHPNPPESIADFSDRAWDACCGKHRTSRATN